MILRPTIAKSYIIPLMSIADELTHKLVDELLRQMAAKFGGNFTLNQLLELPEEELAIFADLVSELREHDNVRF